MKRGITTADVPLDLWGKKANIPKGTKVFYHERRKGWAIESADLLVKLSGNAFAPYSDYAWIPAKFVKENAK